MRLDHCQLHEEEKDELHSLAEDAAVHLIYSEGTHQSDLNNRLIKINDREGIY